MAEAETGLAEPGPEAELAARIAAAGARTDPAAEAALYRLLAPRVRLYGRRHLRDDAAAQDLMQHVMVMTIEKLRAGELREPGRVTSFVFGTCRMAVRDMARAEWRRSHALDTFAADVPVVDIATAPRLDTERVATCLGTLPERDRTVLLLSFYDEQPAEDVAASLGVTPGNVRVIRHRALERLRRCVCGDAS